MDETSPRVVSLDQLPDFKVASGDPDVRGWEVLSSDGLRIGEVQDLLVDRSAMKVRYLDVDLDEDLIADGADRHVLIPVGYARLDRDDDQVTVEGLSEEQIRAIPGYGREPITEQYEATVARHYDPQADGSLERLYERAMYDDRRFFGTSSGNPLA